MRDAGTCTGLTAEAVVERVQDEMRLRAAALGHARRANAPNHPDDRRRLLRHLTGDGGRAIFRATQSADANTGG